MKLLRFNAEVFDIFKMMNHIWDISLVKTALHRLFLLFKISNDSLIFKAWYFDVCIITFAFLKCIFIFRIDLILKVVVGLDVSHVLSQSFFFLNSKWPYNINKLILFYRTKKDKIVTQISLLDMGLIFI